MKIKTDDLVLSSTDLSTASISSDWVWVGSAVNFSVALTWTGTPAGTFKLQASNDAGNANSPVESARGGGVTNAVDVTNKTAAGGGAAGGALIEVQDCGFNWVRVVWTKSGSTGTLTSARICIKSL